MIFLGVLPKKLLFIYFNWTIQLRGFKKKNYLFFFCKEEKEGHDPRMAKYVIIPTPPLNVAPPHPMNLNNQVPDPHLMDKLSWTALVYCFTAGLEFNAILAQVANPDNVSFRVKLLSLLLSIALCLLIAANGIFARTRPNMAFVMDRIGSVIVLVSSTIAAMPTIPEYVSIGCAILMILLYAHQYFYP